MSSPAPRTPRELVEAHPGTVAALLSQLVIFERRALVAACARRPHTGATGAILSALIAWADGDHGAPHGGRR